MLFTCMCHYSTLTHLQNIDVILRPSFEADTCQEEVQINSQNSKVYPGVRFVVYDDFHVTT